MRYRHVRHRYQVLLAGGRSLAWHTAELAVVFAPPRWRPNADVCETSDAVNVTVELAGIEPDDVEILLYEDALVIQGERGLASCGEDGVYHEVGIRRGPFRLELPLPAAVMPTGVEAQQDEGLLRITLLKVGG